MRTTLDLPQNLVEEGMKITGSRTVQQFEQVLEAADPSS